MSVYKNPASTKTIFDSALTVRCTEEQRQKWTSAAYVRGLSLNALVRLALNHYIATNQSPEMPADKK